MRKTRDLFKKIRDTKGTFYAKMGTVKERNIRISKKQKRLREGGKNTQKNCTNKILVTQITMIVVWHSPRARHPEVQSQMGFRKHHYEQN